MRSCASLLLLGVLAAVLPPSAQRLAAADAAGGGPAGGAGSGVTLHADFSAEAWHNTSGAAVAAGWWDAQLSLTAEVEGDPVGLPARSSLFANVHALTNESSRNRFAEAAGAFNAVSNLMAANQCRVYDLYYRQTAPDDTWAVKVGQLAADEDFMTASYNGLFLNSAFGAIPSQVDTPLAASWGGRPAFPIYSVAAPGIWWQLAPKGSRVVWQSGLYYGGMELDESRNHGLSWAPPSRASLVGFTEVAWQSAGPRLGPTRLGLSGHTGLVDDFAAMNAGRSSAEVRGVYGAYLVQEFVLVPGADQRAKVGGFIRAGMSPQRDRSVVTLYGDAGLNWDGPLARRPDDSAGIGIANTHFGPAYRELNALHRDETTVELTYRAKVTGALAVQADVQFLLNSVPLSGARQRNEATIVGLRAVLGY